MRSVLDYKRQYEVSEEQRKKKMKIMICGDLFGDFELLKKDADFIEADHILICGNVGIKTDTSFLDYWEGQLNFTQPIYYVTGKHEDFGLVKEIEESNRDDFYHLGSVAMRDFPPEISTADLMDGSTYPVVKIAGCSGTYSEKYYDKENAPARHMTEKNLLAIKENMDIVLLHNVPGNLGKRSGLDFDMRFFEFLSQKSARYVFVGGYGFPSYSVFPFKDSTVLFLPPIDKGYAIINTDDWSCYFNNKMRKKRDVDVQVKGKLCI